MCKLCNIRLFLRNFPSLPSPVSAIPLLRSLLHNMRFMKNKRAKIAKRIAPYPVDAGKNHREVTAVEYLSALISYPLFSRRLQAVGYQRRVVSRLRSSVLTVYPVDAGKSHEANSPLIPLVRVKVAERLNVDSRLLTTQRVGKLAERGCVLISSADRYSTYSLAHTGT